jgi:hypothetical protein
MPVSRLFLTGALLAVAAALVVGCGGDGQSTTSSLPVPSSAAPWTQRDTLVELDLTWSPAETIPSPEATTITDALASRDLHMLFPSQALEAAGGPVSAEFVIQRRPATNEAEELIVRVNKEGYGNFLALTSHASATEAASKGETSAYTEVEVRGQPGRAWELTSSWPAMLEWQEGGRFFSAEFTGVSIEQMIAWLESWHALP